MKGNTPIDQIHFFGEQFISQYEWLQPYREKNETLTPCTLQIFGTVVNKGNTPIDTKFFFGEQFTSQYELFQP